MGLKEENFALFLIAQPHGNMKVLYAIHLKEAYSIACLVTFGEKKNLKI